MMHINCGNDSVRCRTISSLILGVKTFSWAREGEGNVFKREEKESCRKLYIKYDLNAAAVIRELGYPDYPSLRKWYEEYQATGTTDKANPNPYGYSYEQRKAAVEYYKEHDRNLRGTCRKLGYPAYSKLSEWVTADLSFNCHPLPRGKNVANYTITQKQHAVVSLALGTRNARGIWEKKSESHGALHIAGEDKCFQIRWNP